MTHDIETLTHVLEIVLTIAAIFATAFPVIYMFFPWYSTWLGRFVMLHAISLALALDMTVLFQHWTPKDILVYFWIQLVIFGMIAVAKAGMCAMLLYTQRSKWNLKRSNHGER